jgi:peptide/nickel transport system ATP-binding protein
MAIIIITHDLGVVAEITDEICVMYAGRIIEHASTDRIFEAPEHPYTWGLLTSIPRLDRQRGDDLVPISGRPPSLIQRPSGCFFHPRCPYVQKRHRTVDPPLAPLPDEARHQVACLLEPTIRRRIWSGLKAGRDPTSLRQLAGDGYPARAPAVASTAPTSEASEMRSGEAGAP